MESKQSFIDDEDSGDVTSERGMSENDRNALARIRHKAERVNIARRSGSHGSSIDLTNAANTGSGSNSEESKDTSGGGKRSSGGGKGSSFQLTVDVSAGRRANRSGDGANGGGDGANGNGNGSSMGLASPLASTGGLDASPVSPVLHSPVAFHKRPSKTQDDTSMTIEPVNPCFPKRSSLSKQSMDAMRKAVADAAAKKAQHRNRKLANPQEWVALLKELEMAMDRDVVVLVDRVKSFHRVAQEKEAHLHAATIQELVAQLVRIFHDVANSNYIIQNELFKTSFTRQKPKKMVRPDDTIDDLVTMIRYLLSQLPPRFDSLHTRLRELDREGVNYDEMLDRKRLGKISRYLEDATRGFDELRKLMSSKHILETAATVVQGAVKFKRLSTHH